MSRPLAIFAPIVGQHYHTYLKQEIATLCPGGTVVVSYVEMMGDTTWQPDCPVLSVTKLEASALLPLNGADVATNAAMVPEQYRKAFHTPEFEEKIASFFRSHGVEAVFCEWLDIATPLLQLCKRLGLPYVARSHGTDITAAQMHASSRDAYQAYNTDAKAVLAGSEFARYELHKAGINDDKIIVVPPQGMDAISGAETKSENPDRVVVLMVSRIESMKGPIIALDAFRRAAELMPNLYLECVGKGSLLQAVRQYVQATGLQDRVNVRGYVSWEEAQALRRSSDIFLQASMAVPGEHAMETFGVSILEAMAHGLPVVSTQYQAFSELVREGETGLLAEQGDSKGLARGLIRLAEDATLRREMRRKSIDLVNEQYCVAKQRQDVLEALGLQHVIGAG